MVVATQQGEVLLQKRSASMITHPGGIDISAGGYVDARETPEQAAIRELQEEMGFAVSAKDLRLVKIYRQNHNLPKLRKKSRVFLYSYVALLPSAVDVTQVQANEVAWARFVPLRQAKQLCRRQRIKSLGRLVPKTRVYKDALAAIEQWLVTR
ncbi:MAG: hypothetical protein JWN82_440 [Candidatus Saccharibacteria bacterium]|nr:hypothetical protein [Candidatus Saccharibacteria bacterium]